MQSSQATVNISAYKFVTLDDTTDLRPRFLQERLLDLIAARPGVWFARKDEIAHAWRAGVGLAPWQPAAPGTSGQQP